MTFTIWVSTKMYIYSIQWATWIWLCCLLVHRVIKVHWFAIAAETNATQILESHQQIKEVLFQWGGGGGGWRGVYMTLIWILKAFLSSIEEKAMWVSVFYYCNCDFPSHCCSFVAISCLMLLFEGHVACQNLTLTVHQ